MLPLALLSSLYTVLRRQRAKPKKGQIPLPQGHAIPVYTHAIPVDGGSDVVHQYEVASLQLEEINSRGCEVC